VSPGATETLDAWRKGKNLEISVDVGRNGDDVQTASVGGGPEAPSGQPGLRSPAIGLGLMDVTPDVRQAMNLAPNQRGALVESVNPDKAASASGIQPGDIIVAVNQATVRDARQADQAIAQAGKAGKKSVLLLVERGDAQMFVAVPFANG
ncbi:MAG: PDZ domain-containing protein, partial [Mesorhizobium sp.]